MTQGFEVGDKVNYVPDPEDHLRYLVRDNRARVAELASPEDTNYWIGIRFNYDPEVYPVRPDELQKVEA